MATAAGKTSAVFGLWATFPAEPIDGLIVSDRLFTFLYKESAPPPASSFPPIAKRGRATASRAPSGRWTTTPSHAYLPWLSRGRLREGRRLRRSVLAAGQRAAAHADRDHASTAICRCSGSASSVRISPSSISRAPTRSATCSRRTRRRGRPRSTQEDFDRYSARARAFLPRARRAHRRSIRDRRSAVGGVLMIASDHGFSGARAGRRSSRAWRRRARRNGMRRRACICSGARACRRRPGHGGQGDVQQVCATLLALAGLPPGRDVNGDPLEGAHPASAPRADYAAQLSPGRGAGGERRRARRSRGGRQPEVARLHRRRRRATRRRRAAAARRAPPGSYNNEGVILKERGKLPQAIEAFEKALARRTRASRRRSGT